MISRLLVAAGAGSYPRLLMEGARKAGVARVDVAAVKGSTARDVVRMADVLAGMGTGPTKAFILAGSTGSVPKNEPTDARIFVEPDRGKAIAYALTNAEKGDVVIIAGKGHETTQEIKGVKYPFDDREAVRSFRRFDSTAGF